jgi:hypothetical protein
VAKATIKSKTGALITVEGSEKEISAILSVFETTTAVSHAKRAITKGRAVEKEEKKRSSVSNLIIDLNENGFFEKPKSLSDVSEALEEMGSLCPTTSLSGVVLGLVKRRFLSRKKIDGRWAYGK